MTEKAQTKPLLRAALGRYFQATENANPGLLLQKGMPEIEHRGDKLAADSGAKQQHIERLCEISASPLYQQAFERWLRLVKVHEAFQATALKLESRLLLGSGAGGALETSCALSHVHGMPYIPGTSIKGAVRSWAAEALPEHTEVLDQLLGRNDTDPLGASASPVSIYDAWWIPDSKIPNTNRCVKPFVKEIVNPHHSEYYASAGAKPALDSDSPIPSFLLGVQGSFLFVVQGETALCKTVLPLIEQAMLNGGVGGKTAAGYGYMQRDISWLKENIFSGEQCLEEEVRSLNEKTLVLRFSKDRAKTLKRKDLPEFLAMVNKIHGELIQRLSETPSDHDNHKKALKEFKKLGLIV